MGAVVENWSIDRIEEKYGIFQELVEYVHYGNGWVRPPGTTEDGIERQKLMCALINAGDLDAVLEDVYEIASVYQHPNSQAFP